MKKMVVLLAIVLWLAAGTATALAAPAPEEPLETLADALPKDTQEAMGALEGSDGESFGAQLRMLLLEGIEDAGRMARQQMGGAAALLVIVLLCEGAELLYSREGDHRLLHCTAMTGALAVVMLSAGELDRMIGLGAETIHTMNDFSKTLLPMMAMACAASGGAASAAVRETVTAVFVDLLLTLIDRLLIPLCYLYIGASTAHAVLQQHSLETIARGIRKLVIWSLTGLVTVFTAYLTVSGVLSGTADAAALRAAKFAISGAVPVVGGILSNAASTLLVGASAMKNAIGVFGTLALFSLCLLPFLQLGMQYLFYKIAAFFAELVDQSGLSGLISAIGGAFGLMLGMVGACALLLLISLVTSITVVMPL